MRTTATLLCALAIGACGGDASVQDSGGDGPRIEGPLQYTPIAQWDNFAFEDKAVRLYIPPDPIGVVFFFHGTNGNVTIVNQLEPVAFLNELIAEGIGFVTTDSGQQPEGKWIDGDTERVGRLYQHVIDTTDLDATDALFTAGFSGGGNMTGDFAVYAQAKGWPITAMNPNQSSCGACGDAGIPTAWVLSENDTPPHEWATNGYDDLKASGVPARLWMHDEVTLAPDSFLKHPDMTAERSQQVFDDLIAKEFIDASGTRLVSVEEADTWCTWYAANGESFGPEGRADELRVLWALHRYSAEYARDVRDFFLEQL